MSRITVKLLGAKDLKYDPNQVACLTFSMANNDQLITKSKLLENDELRDCGRHFHKGLRNEIDLSFIPAFLIRYSARCLL